MTLPDCMMPDGADPCKGFAELHAENERLRKNMRGLAGVELSEENDRLIDENKRLRSALGILGDDLDAILDKYSLPRTMPIGWRDEDYERVADWIEPMRREVERLREKAHQKQIEVC